MSEENRPCSLVKSRCKIFEELAAQNASTSYPVSPCSWKNRNSNPFSKFNPVNRGISKESDECDKHLSHERLDNIDENYNNNKIVVEDDDASLQKPPISIEKQVSNFGTDTKEDDECPTEAINSLIKVNDEVDEIYEEIISPDEEPIYEEINNEFITKHKVNEEIDEEQVEDGYDHEFDDDQHSDYTDSFDDSSEPEVDSEMQRRDSIFISGKLPQIANELLTTEEDYIRTLESGISKYVAAMVDKELPDSLKGQKYHIFGVIEKIYEFHKNQFYPALKNCDSNIIHISETFSNLIRSKQFYVYVMYAMNKPRSYGIAKSNEKFFKELQDKIDDKLGIFSFLMQPIQRLPKYRMLLAELIKELMRNERHTSHEYKMAMAAACIAEKELERVLEAANGAVAMADILFVDGLYVDIYEQGRFLKSGEFDMNDTKNKKKFNGKVFLFEKSLIYTEYIAEDKKKLLCHGVYKRETMGIDQNARARNKFKLFVHRSGNEEIEFTGSVDTNADEWYNSIRDILMEVVREEKKKIALMKFPTRINDTKIARINRDSIVSSETGRDSVASATSDFYSYRSSSMSSDSYEINRSTWKERRHTETMYNSEKYYLLLLSANRKFYLNELSTNPSLKSFIKAYDRIYHFHNKTLYPALKNCGCDMNTIFTTFTKYLRERKFETYLNYSVLANAAAQVIEKHHSNPRLESENLIMSVKDFVGYPVKRLKAYLLHFEILVKEIQQVNWNSELFKTSAVLVAEMSNFQKNVEENFKLYSIKQTKVRVAIYGKIKYSDLVSLDVLGTLNHRIFIMDEGLICVKVKEKASTKEEKFKEIIFNVPFSLGLVMRGSKKVPKKVNFDTGKIKAIVPSITFKNIQKQHMFCKNILNYI